MRVAHEVLTKLACERAMVTEAREPKRRRSLGAALDELLRIRQA